MPTAWRIAKTTLAATAFDGEGARLYGGRWNSAGIAVVYTAQSKSLAALELLVHLQTSQLLASYCSIPVQIGNELVEVVDPDSLPANWNEYPAPTVLQEIGDRWATEQRSVALQVPSAIVPNELDYILNPGHPEFSRIAIGQAQTFRFDPRLK